MARVTQDDARENKQIELFGLTPLQGRSNKYIPDATIVVNGAVKHIELKTSDSVKKQVSTARNVTLPKLEEYKKVHWVFSQYEKTEDKDGFRFTGQHYYCPGSKLEPWCAAQKEKLMWGTKTYAGLGHWEKIAEVCKESIDESVIQRMDNVLRKRAGLNDPKISWKYVQEHCVKLDNNRLQEHLEELLR